MTFPAQKSFGDFIRERHGRNWVYAARSTPRILAQYQKYNPDTGEHEPPVVITPKQQRQLKIDYAKAWGREHDPQYWQMLCALRDIVALHRKYGNSRGLFTPEVIESSYQAAEYAIEEALKA